VRRGESGNCLLASGDFLIKFWQPLGVFHRFIKAGTLIVFGEKLNIVASVGSAVGTFTVSGSAVLNGTPLKIDARVGTRESAGHTTDTLVPASSLPVLAIALRTPPA